MVFPKGTEYIQFQDPDRVMIPITEKIKVKDESAVIRCYDKSKKLISEIRIQPPCTSKHGC